jgi:2-polyprenyl-6-methoxyphenol hydroxylase-like FAD-dependent oxidoreductase
MNEQADLVIVGAGLGGLVLALALAGEGRRIVVLEAQDQFPMTRRGEILQPQGLEMLDRMGLLDVIRKEPCHVNEAFHFHRIGGPRLCTVDYRALEPPYNYCLINLPSITQAAVLERLRADPEVEIRMGCVFEGVIREGGRGEGGRIAGVRYRRQGELVAVRTPLVVGADGVQSPVREALGIPARVRVYRDAYLVVLAPRPPGFHRDGRYHLGRRQILGLFPISDDRLYLFYLVPRKALAQYEARGLPALREEISAVDPAMREPLEQVRAWEEVATMPCRRVRADRWTADGAALLGDAAHAMNPHVGQGRNQAMADALALAPVLATCFRKGDFSRQALAPYEAARRPQVDLLQRLADEETFFWNAGDPARVWLRDRVFRRMDARPDVAGKILRTVAGLAVEPLTFRDRLRMVL